MKLGATRDGRLTALQARVVFDAGAFAGAPLSIACLLLMDYALPGIDHVPRVEPILVEIPSEAGPFGAKGVGEPPVVAAGAAIANAVADATGRTVTALPIRQETLARAA